MKFPGLPLDDLDHVTLAVRDILDQDPLHRDLFGGRTLAGTASITPGSTALVGTGTFWATGDDSLAEGDRLVLEDQVAWVDTVAGDGGVTIRTPHADGMSDVEIFKAGRAKRVQSAADPTSRAQDFWTVGAAAFVEIDPGINRLISNPAVTVRYYIDPGHQELDDDEASWAGLLRHAVNLIKNEPGGGRLCVPRFHNGAGTAVGLTLGFDGAAPGFDEIGAEAVIVPSVVLNFRGDDGLNSSGITQRW